MNFGHIELAKLAKNPNRDRLWLVGYMELGSKHGYFEEED